MKLINKSNFISIVCISFTLIVCGKLLIEKLMGFTDKNYTGNIFTCLMFSVLITAVLALHYYLQKYPLLPVLIGQYAAVIIMTVLYVKVVDIVADTSTNALWQMILSVTIPYVVSSVVYYITFFRQVRKGNMILESLKSIQENG